MDFNKLIARVKNILLTPKTEWPAIAGETETVQSLYLNYILVLAALTPAAMFLGNLIFGTYVPFLGTIRPGIASLVTSFVLGYGGALLIVFVVSLITDVLAPSFGGQKNPVQALKAAAYSSTPVWVVGALYLLPGIGFLVWLLSLAAAVYGVYLLYIGLPATMKSDSQRSIGYAVAIIVVNFILSLILAGIVSAGSRISAPSSNFSLGSDSSSISIDKDSTLGKLAAMGAAAEKASKNMEAAQKSGDANAQAQATGQMLGAVLGGGSQVEALAPDALKPFVPETLDGMKRTSLSVERNGAMGMQVSNATATYSDGQRSLHLEIADTGSAKGMMALAGAIGVESSQETDHGYDKTYKQDGRLVHEQWDSQNKDGEFSIVLGDRFSVKVNGNAESIDQLKAAVGSINLAGLEALKNQGVKNQ